MILLFRVARIARGSHGCRSRERLAFAQRTVETPSSCFRIKAAVLSHDRDADALPLEAAPFMLIHFQALVHKHRAVWKFAGREAFQCLGICIVMMEAGVGSFPGDEAARDGPGPIPGRIGYCLPGIG